MEESNRKHNFLYPNIIHAPAKEGDGRLCNAQAGTIDKTRETVDCRKCLKKLGRKPPRKE